jgi:ribonuclease BN (tRNA processing enzyme)
MRVTFAGVGEAFDENLPNTSILVESGTSSILLDCGFSAPGPVWKLGDRASRMDAIFVSHFHADHYFGIPALLARFAEEGRKERLTILGPTGIEGRVRRLLEMAYSNILAKAGFDVYFLECTPGDEFKHAGFNFAFAMGDHLMPCLALRLTADGKSLLYSGDGRPTDSTRKLARGCDFVIHEAFALNRGVPGHGTVEAALAFAAESGARACALIHMDRAVRHAKKDVIMDHISSLSGLHGFLPEPGDTFDV